MPMLIKFSIFVVLMLVWSYATFYHLMLIVISSSPHILSQAKGIGGGISLFFSIESVTFFSSSRWRYFWDPIGPIRKKWLIIVLSLFLAFSSCLAMISIFDIFDILTTFLSNFAFLYRPQCVWLTRVYGAKKFEWNAARNLNLPIKLRHKAANFIIFFQKAET